MDLQMQKHRMTRWLERSATALLLVLFVTASPAQAAVESVAPVADGGIWLFWDPSQISPPTSSPDVACNSGYNLYWAGPNGFTYLGSVPNQYGYASLGYRDCKFLDTKQGIIAYLGSIRRVPFPPTCPIPTVNPTVLYVFNVLNNMCERPAQCVAPNAINPSTGQCEPPKVLTITIEPAGSYLPTNGTYTVQPSTTLPLDAIVKDQNGLVQAGKQVSLTVNVQSGTDGVPDGNGGHIHTENRPKGKFACSSVWDPGSETATCTLTTDGNGQAPFIFIPTAVSGAHTITATCNNCTPATAPVNVKVDSLITIPASPMYALSDSNGVIGVIGAIPGKHTDNHYLTVAAIGQLNALARLYKTKINPKAILYLNDASLVWGGLFDVGSTPWVSPHSLHDTGVSLDIRAANSGPNNDGAVLATDFREFLKQANREGFKMGLHCKNSSDTNYCLGQPNNRHFHVDF